MATSHGNKKNLNSPKVHCFICSQCSYPTALAPQDPSVSRNFRRILKKICEHRFPKGHVLVKQISCLGHCKDGISSVIYPQRIVTTNLCAGQESQIADIIGQLLQEIN